MLLGRFSSEWYRFMNYRCTLYAKNCRLLNFQKVLELCVLFHSFTSSCQSYFRGLDVPKYKQNPHRLADLCAVRISFQPSLNAHDMAENTLISQFKSRKFARAQRRHNVLLIRRISVYMYGVAWDSINVDWCFERAMRKRERMRRAHATWHSEDLQKTSIFFSGNNSINNISTSNDVMIVVVASSVFLESNGRERV